MSFCIACKELLVPALTELSLDREAFQDCISQFFMLVSFQSLIQHPLISVGMANRTVLKSILDCKHWNEFTWFPTGHVLCFLSYTCLHSPPFPFPIGCPHDRGRQTASCLQTPWGCTHGWTILLLPHIVTSDGGQTAFPSEPVFSAQPTFKENI